MFRRLALAAGVSLAACGPIDFPPEPLPGEICYQDSDCVPNGCCGMGTAIVEKSHAPDCSAVKCDGTCPASGIKCGCALPVCRSARCASAVATTPNCP
jgi:hypothetical protein